MKRQEQEQPQPRGESCKGPVVDPAACVRGRRDQPAWLRQMKEGAVVQAEVRQRQGQVSNLCFMKSVQGSCWEALELDRDKML